MGVYPLFPDGTCRFLVFDFDCHTKEASTRDFANLDDAWIEEVNAMRQICAVNQIPALVERSRSGKGAHLWIFFDHPMDASLVRRFGFALLDRGAESVNLKSFQYYDRMLPAQDSLSDEQSLGNLIALPLQGQALKEGNSAFIDENWIPYPNQWEVLFATKRLSQVDLEHCMEEWNIQSDVQNLIPDGETKPWEYTNRFHKEDVTGVMHITLANRVYVETSNIRPRLQNQIRRMASISNPRYFKNAAMGLSNYASPRYIYLGEDEGEYLAIPRGLLENLKDRCAQKEIPYQITDQRTTGREISVTFTGELCQNQEAALQELLKYDCGILSAATAFGKQLSAPVVLRERRKRRL
jgi:hypothetical protein